MTMNYCHEYHNRTLLLLLPSLDPTDPYTLRTQDMIICRDGKVYWADLDPPLAGQIAGWERGVPRNAYVDILIDILGRIRVITKLGVAD